MNRRDFLKRSGTTAVAVAAVAAVPIVESKTTSDFPSNEEEMRKIIKELGPAKYRPEGGMILEGLSATQAGPSIWWYYHKGDRTAVLHERSSDGHVCFDVQKVSWDKPTYTAPLPQQWARNRKYGQD